MLYGAWSDRVAWIKSFLNDNSLQIHFCVMDSLEYCILKVCRWIAANSTDLNCYWKMYWLKYTQKSNKKNRTVFDSFHPKSSTIRSVKAIPRSCSGGGVSRIVDMVTKREKTYYPTLLYLQLIYDEYFFHGQLLIT